MKKEHSAAFDLLGGGMKSLLEEVQGPKEIDVFKKGYPDNENTDLNLVTEENKNPQWLEYYKSIRKEPKTIVRLNVRISKAIDILLLTDKYKGYAKMDVINAALREFLEENMALIERQAKKNSRFTL